MTKLKLKINDLLKIYTVEEIKTCLNEHKGYLNNLELKSNAWISILENDCLKRAIEIAIAGNHNITIIGNPANGQNYLEVILGNLLTFIKPCPCGNFQDNLQICTCGNIQILKYQQSVKFKKAMQNPIIVNLETSRTLKNNSEDFKDILKRIGTVYQGGEMIEIDTKAFEILTVFQKKYFPTLQQIENIKKLAETISRLDQDNQIKAHHISESIQYQILSFNL